MAKMNYKQIEHCQKRLSTITASKIGQRPVKPEPPSEEDFVQSILSGERTISNALLKRACEKWQDKKSYHYDLQNALIELTFAEESKKELAAYEKQRKIYDALRDRVRAERDSIEDEIVLGDQAAAMALLRAFETWQP